MTPQIITTLAVLSLAVALFISGRLRIDLVALLVLAALALTGLVTPAESLSGFSDPAVVTMWAVFILGGGLAKTGVVNLVGRIVLRLAGRGEMRLMVMIMLAGALLSAFMNNVGVVALLLPVTVNIARRTGLPPSKLLMPLAFSVLLGGMTTLIGTPPNILISDALHTAGLRSFGFFDFTPLGLGIVLAGVAFLATIGRRLLPARDMQKEFNASRSEVFNLRERLYLVHIPQGSPLSGQTLAQSRLGAVLNLNVIGIMREGRTLLAPGVNAALQGGDQLLVTGRLDRLDELREHQMFNIVSDKVSADDLMRPGIELAEIGIRPASPLCGKTLRQIEFRRSFQAHVLAIRHGERLKRTSLQDIPLQAGDVFLVQAPSASLHSLEGSAFFEVAPVGSIEAYRLHERLLLMDIPEDSPLIGKSLTESRLGDAFGLNVLNILRGDDACLFPSPEEIIQRGDRLLVEGKAEKITLLRSLGELEVKHGEAPGFQELETEEVGQVQVILSPYSTLAGKTLRELHFREKYELSVLAIWREGRSYRSSLRDMALRFGDALLLYGPRDKMRLLSSEPDFVVMSGDIPETPRRDKAILASLIMLGVVVVNLMGWLPVSIAAVLGAALMVLSGCIKMDEAYRYIEWQAVFLTAGTLPLGIALQKTGTAAFLVEHALALTQGLSPYGMLAALFLLTALMTQFIPSAALAVLMTPFVLGVAGSQGYSPHALMMAVALAISTGFLTPLGAPVNVLIMGPGGYRMKDYFKVGLPLIVVVLAAVLLLLPLIWPLYG